MFTFRQVVLCVPICTSILLVRTVGEVRTYASAADSVLQHQEDGRPYTSRTVGAVQSSTVFPKQIGHPRPGSSFSECLTLWPTSARTCHTAARESAAYRSMPCRCFSVVVASSFQVRVIVIALLRSMPDIAEAIWTKFERNSAKDRRQSLPCSRYMTHVSAVFSITLHCTVGPCLRSVGQRREAQHISTQ